MAEERIDIVISGVSRDAVRATDAETEALFRMRTAASEADSTVQTLDKTNRKLTTGMRDTNRAVTFFGNAVKLVKFPAMIAGAGAAAQAIGGLSAGVVSLTSALAPLTGALTAYPALLGSLAQGALTTKLAFAGVSEALDGNKEALKALTPEAQKFVKTLNEYKQLTGGLETAAQRGLFGGVTEGLDAAIGNLGRLESVVGATSESLGHLAEQAGRFVGREGFGRDFETIGRGNARLLRELGEAGLNFADSLRHVMVEAQPLIAWMGRGLVSLSEWTKESARMNRENGDMARFFRQTRDVISDLVDIGGSLASTFRVIGRAAAPLGRDIVDSLVKGADALERWAESTEGRRSIEDYFRRARPIVYEVGRLVRDLSEAFLSLSTDPGAAQFIRLLRTELLPVLVELTRETTEQFGPVLIDFLVEAGKLFANFVGSSGPLVTFVSSLSNAAKILNRLIEIVPGLGDALSSALTAFSIYKLLGFGSAAGVATAGRKIGTTLGTSMGTSAVTATSGVFGGPGGSAAGGRLKGLASSAAMIGKRVLGVNLALGVMAGIASEAPKLEGKLQDTFSTISFGLIPTWEQSAEKHAEAYTRALNTHLSETELKESLADTILGVVPESVFGIEEFIPEDLISGIIPKLKELSLSFHQGGQAVAAWKDRLRVAYREGEISRESYVAQRKELNKYWHEFVQGRRAIDVAQDRIRDFEFATDDSMKAISKSVDRNMDFIKRTLGAKSEAGRRLMEKNFEAAIDNVDKQMDRGSVSVEKGLATMTKLLAQQLKAFGIDAKREGKFISTPRRLVTPGNVAETAQNAGGRQRGGDIPGSGTGDTVDAKLEPGEYVLNARAASQIGKRNLDRLNFRDMPRFQGGGMVDPAGPGTGVVNRAIAGTVGNWSTRYNAAINYGYDPGGGHVSEGHNVYGTATDTSPAGGWGAGPTRLFETGLRKLVAAGLTVLYGDHGVGTPYPDHGYANHAHIEWGMSPLIKGMGGTFGFGGIKLPQFEAANFPLAAATAGGLNLTSAAIEKNVNKKLARMGLGSSGAGGQAYQGPLNKTFPQNSPQTISFDQAAFLAERAGLPGETYAQIAIGESGLRPGAVSGDGGYGLWQMTPRVQSSATVSAWNRIGSYFNPWHNAQMADFLAGSGTGVSNYYGTGSVTDFNKHYTGPSFLAAAARSAWPAAAARPRRTRSSRR